MSLEKVECVICNKKSPLIAKALQICGECLKIHPENAKPFAGKAHRKSKGQFSLPAFPPSETGGAKCNLCVNRCRIGAGKMGYCGLRENCDGKLYCLVEEPERGVASYYYDWLPTNCVADWVCPAGSTTGYPKYSYTRGKEYGYKNLAVFLGACTFDCLFCQNWQFRRMTRDASPALTAEELACAVDAETACICFFGGDPSAQMPFALRAAKIASEKNRGRILRICWETNGSMNKSLAKKMAEISIVSGGCVKFDLKAWNDNLHIALTGVTNRRTLNNFEMLAEYTKERTEPPFLIASTLMVPGYVNAEEVYQIAKFISDIDSSIPYSLLAFYPCFQFMDLPTTSFKLANECYEAAKAAGLKRIKIGNPHLLS